MSKIALATAVVALIAAPLAIGRAEAQPAASYKPPPGAAPPWANTATTTETPPAPSPTATPAPGATAAPAPTTTQAPGATASVAATPSQTDQPNTTTPAPVGMTPMQGTTTPIRAVSLRAGPNSSAPVIGTLHAGDQLEILATANYGWTQVRSPAGVGWAYGSYLAQGSTAAAVQPPAPPPQDVISR
jgi:hypothetical protein